MQIDIVLIHGFSHLTGEKRFSHLIKRIRKEFSNANIIVPNYLEKYSDKEIKTKFLVGQKSLDAYAEMCHKKIKRSRNHGDKLIIIGTSMGGLIARVLIEKFGVPADAVILAGVPNDGVNINMLEKFFLIFFRKTWVREIKKRNTFISKMNEELELRNLATRYYLMAGLQDKRVPKKSALALHAFKTIEVNASHWEIIPQPETDPDASGKICDLIIEWIREAAK